MLVAGGGKSSTGAKAEVYNPATGTWSPTGSLVTYRSHHAAVLLANGQVLVMGGADGAGNALSSAELYDPSTGSWTPTGSMASGRRFHTATLLPGGQVLVAGGGSDSARSASTEVYDAATGTWSASGSMATPRRNHTATWLNSGQQWQPGLRGAVHRGEFVGSADTLVSAQQGRD